MICDSSDNIIILSTNNLDIFETFKNYSTTLTDTGENVEKWTRVFSTRSWVILVALTRRKTVKKITWPLLGVFACGHLSSPRLYRLSFIFENRSWHCCCWVVVESSWSSKVAITLIDSNSHFSNVGQLFK